VPKKQENAKGVVGKLVVLYCIANDTIVRKSVGLFSTIPKRFLKKLERLLQFYRTLKSELNMTFNKLIKEVPIETTITHLMMEKQGLNSLATAANKNLITIMLTYQMDFLSVLIIVCLTVIILYAIGEENVIIERSQEQEKIFVPTNAYKDLDNKKPNEIIIIPVKMIPTLTLINRKVKNTIKLKHVIIVVALMFRAIL